MRSIAVRVRRLVAGGEGVLDRLLNLAVIGRVEGLSATPVRQRKSCGHPNVLDIDVDASAPGCMGDGGACHDEVGAHPVYLGGGAYRCDLAQWDFAEVDLCQPSPGAANVSSQFRLSHYPLGDERDGIGLERQAPAHHDRTHLGIAWRSDINGQPEPVEQLGTQFPLLRVHRADQQESTRVLHRHAVTFDVTDAQRRRVKQQVDKVVVQEIDLVDVEQAAMRRRENSRLERSDTTGQRPFEVERSDQSVFGGAHRKFDESGQPRARGRIIVRTVRAV